MPRKARAQRFLIEPLAVTRDPAFEAMSHAARGVYLTILLEAWFERDPGVIRYSPEKLARMGQVSVDEWLGMEEEIRPAFSVREEESRSGPNAPSRCDSARAQRVTWWILPLMGAAFLAQNAKRDSDRNRKRRQRLGERDSEIVAKSESHVGSGSGSGTGTRQTTDGSRASEPARSREADRVPAAPVPAGGLVASLVRNLEARRPTSQAEKGTP